MVEILAGAAFDAIGGPADLAGVVDEAVDGDIHFGRVPGPGEGKGDANDDFDDEGEGDVGMFVRTKGNGDFDAEYKV